MTETVEMKMMKVVCDHCGWEKETDVDGIREFAGHHCPECGEGPVISDEDIEALDAILALQAAVNAVPLPEHLQDAARVDIAISTAPRKIH